MGGFWDGVQVSTLHFLPICVQSGKPGWCCGEVNLEESSFLWHSRQSAQLGCDLKLTLRVCVERFLVAVPRS